jgi:SAM-dependent methyltransferase
MIFPPSSYKYVSLHCNNNLELFINPPEINMVQEYFAKASPENVLELGCGLGRVSLGFYKRFKTWRDTEFWLLDGNSGDKQICGVDSSDGSYYNDLHVTLEFCYINGMPDEHINLINMEDKHPFDEVFIKFDFVYSFLAIGFHWPIDWYLKRIDPFIRSGTILIFGIRPHNKAEYVWFNKRQFRAIPDCFEVLKTVTTRGRRDNFIVLRRK